MPQIRIYTSDPGSTVLQSFGPAIHVIQSGNRSRNLGTGVQSVLAIGAVVNDRGQPNVPHLLADMGEFERRWGGFSPHLGNGNAAGYEGNLYAQLRGLDFPRLVLLIPDMAVKDDATGLVDELITFTRADASNGEAVIPAGTRLRPAAGSLRLATLEDVVFGEDETGDKGVRVRQVTYAAELLNTVDTFVDSNPDANITIKTASATAAVGEEIDAAELLLRYTEALTHTEDNIHGQQATILACDQQVSGIVDLLSTTVGTRRGKGFLCKGVVSPSIGVASSVAQGAVGEGVGRASLANKGHVYYVHPGVQRGFPLDSDNLTPDDYLVSVPAAFAFASRLAWTRPGDSAARPHPVLASYGVVGGEPLPTPGGSDEVVPTQSVHWQANITQPILDSDPLTGAYSATFFDDVLADGTDGPLSTLEDFLTRRLVAIALPYHKEPATPDNRNDLVDAVIADFQLLQNPRAGGQPYLTAFGVEGDWDAANEVFTLVVEAQPVGNLKTIVVRLTVAPDAVTVD